MSWTNIFFTNIFQITGVTLRFICISQCDFLCFFLETYYHSYLTVSKNYSYLNHRFSVYRSCLYLCLKKKLYHPEHRSQFQQSMKGSLLQVWSHLPGWRDWMGSPVLPAGRKTAGTAAQLQKQRWDTLFTYSQGKTIAHYLTGKLYFPLATLTWK